MLTLLTGTGTTTTGGGMNTIYTIVMIVVLLAVFYFFGIRPQKKQEREVNAMRSQLVVGDEITTIGGIIGKIISIKEETVMIETGHDRTKIRILKSAVRCVDVHAADAGTAIPAETKDGKDNKDSKNAKPAEESKTADSEEKKENQDA